MNPLKSHYVQLQLKLHDMELLGTAPGLTHVYVFHDNDCAVMTGGRICDCDPEVRVNGKTYLYSRVVKSADN